MSDIIEEYRQQKLAALCREASAICAEPSKSMNTNKQPSTVCACCGKSESEHHQFVPIMRPQGCKCNVTDWRDNHNIPPVCDKWDPAEGGFYCKNCEHDKECH